MDELGNWEGGKTSIYAPVRELCPSISSFSAHFCILVLVSFPNTAPAMNYPIQRPLHPINLNASTYSSLRDALTPRPTVVAVQHGGSNRGSHSPRPVEPPHITVHFDSGRGTSGVSFGDVKQGRLNWMGDQPVSELLSLGQISVNLDITVRAMYCIDAFAEAEYTSQWPGYGHLQRSYPLEIISNNRPVTHGYLALQIVKAYERFFDVRVSRDRVSAPALIPAHHTVCAKGDLRGHSRRERHDVGDWQELLPHALPPALGHECAHARSWSLPGEHPGPHGLASATRRASLSPLPRSPHTLDAARTRDGLCP